MPAKDLFDLLDRKKDTKYSEALEMLRADSDLVNAINDDTGLSLVQSCIFDLKQDDASQAFIEFVVTHAKLNFSFITEGKDTNQEALIGSGRTDLVDLVLGKKEFLFIGTEPTYLTAQKRLKSDTAVAIRKHARTNPGSPPLDPKTDSHLAKVTQITNNIREATIKYAVEQDDPDLIIKLQKADNDSAEYQPGGKMNLLIVSLAKEKHVKVNAWLAGTYSPASAKAPVSAAPAGVGKSAHTLYAITAVKELEKILQNRPTKELERLAQLEKQLAQAEAARKAVYDQAIAHGSAVLAEMHAVLNDDSGAFRP